MATQMILPNVLYGASLIFKDASGNTGVGPVGVLSSSDPAITATLAADGQSMTVEVTTALAAMGTVTWTDPTGVIPAATMDIELQAPTFVASSVSFSDLTPVQTS